MSQKLPALLNDALAVSTQLRAMVREQMGLAQFQRDSEAVDFLKRLEPILYAHTTQLQESIARVQAPEPSLKTGLANLLGTATTWLERARSEHEVSRDLRDAGLVLDLAIAVVQRLHAGALAYGDRQSAEIAGVQLGELVSARVELAHIAPRVLLRELEEDGTRLDGAAYDAVTETVRRCWGGEKDRVGHGSIRLAEDRPERG